MRAEDFFPLGWDTRKFRRQPYPDMTYGEAIEAAKVTLWNMDAEFGADTHYKLAVAKVEFAAEHEDFPGRSCLNVTDFNDLWRGPVTTLLTWFKKAGG